MPAKVPLTALPVTRVAPVVGLKFLITEVATPVTVPRAMLEAPRRSRMAPAPARLTAVSA